MASSLQGGLQLPPMAAESADGAIARAKLYVATSCCSLVCCSLVLLLHARSRRLSRFPSSIMLWRIVCDSLLCVQLIVLNMQILAEDDAQTVHDGSAACGPRLAFIAQFSLFGSLGWYACLALNLYLSVTRPFTRPSDRMGLFHTWVWLGSAATGALAAARHGYRSLYQLCWIVSPSGGQLGIYNWALLGGWVVTYPVLSTLALAYCEWVLHFDRDRENIANRLRPRRAQLRASRVATAGFSAFWGGLGTAYVYLYFAHGWGDSAYQASAQHTFALFIGLLGTCDAVMWVAVQLAANPPALAAASGYRGAAAAAVSVSDETWRAREDDLSDALRRAFVRNTILGVVTSTRTANAEAISVYPTRRRVGAISVPDASGAPSGGRATRRAVEEDCCGCPHDGCCGLYGWCHHSAIWGWGWVRTRLPKNSRPKNSRPTIYQVTLSALSQPLLPADDPRPVPSVSASAAAPPPVSAVPSRGRFGRFTTATGDFVDESIPQLSRSHFNEVWTLQVAQNVFFQDFAPMVWQALRQLVFHVSFKSYLFSLEGDGQLEAFVDQMVGNFSEGRSGGFFFTSADKRYLVKTLTSKEQRRLLKILPRYYEYLRSHPHSLLSRFYGCYSITMHGQTRCFAVMENIFHAADGPDLERYDLKGSWLSRTANPGAGTKMDCDLKRSVRLPPDVSAEVAAQCASDAELLRSLNLMDYSLLVGIETKHPRGSVPEGGGAAGPAPDPHQPRLSCSRPEPTAAPHPDPRASYSDPRAPPLRPRAGSGTDRRLRGPIAYSADPTAEPGVVYYVAIIDLLQTWDWTKRVERWLKVLLYCRCGQQNAIGMSAVEPGAYARRFVAMIRRVMEEGADADQPSSGRAHQGSHCGKTGLGV